MRALDHDGLRLGVGGEGDVRVVLVHGAMDRGAGFLRVARRLDGVEWVVLDRRGYGRSFDANAAAPEFDRHVGDLLDLLEFLPPKRTVLVGHSIGATIAAAVVARRPGLVDALVVYETPLPWMPWWPIADAAGRRIEDDPPEVAVDRFMERVVGAEVWAEVPERTKAQRRAEGAALISELVSVRRRPAFDPEAITVPTFVARGSRCDETRVRAFEWLVDEIPDARPRVIDDAPHVAHSTHPAAFAAIIDESVALIRHATQ